MRIQGIIKMITALILSSLVMTVFIGGEISAVATILIALYAWLGEYTGLIRVGAISENKLGAYERKKLQRIKEEVTKRVKNKMGEDMPDIRLHVIPSDEVNGMAFGFSNVAITRGALDSCDELTLCALLSHEVSHILCLDAVFNRIIFGNITCMVIGLMILSFVSVSFIWIMFLILVLCGVCRGFISMYITSGLSKGVKKVFEVIQKAVLFICQASMGVVSRWAEYRADEYAVDLGFGVQLNYFLNRFITDQDNGIRSLSEILYASHPSVHMRIQRIEQRKN